MKRWVNSITVLDCLLTLNGLSTIMMMMRRRFIVM